MLTYFRKLIISTYVVHAVNRGLIIGIAVGGAAALLVIAGLSTYALWQKKRAQKAIILANPFGMPATPRKILTIYLLSFKLIHVNVFSLLVRSHVGIKRGRRWRRAADKTSKILFFG